MNSDYRFTNRCGQFGLELGLIIIDKLRIKRIVKKQCEGAGSLRNE